jgi:hypothetical protein
MKGYFSMFKFKSKRALVLGVVASLAIVAAAVAYWTTSGSGSDAASVSAGAAALTVSETTTLTPMYPGDTAQTLSGTVTNNAANKVKIDSVTATIASVTKDPQNNAAGTCDATDFTLADTTMTVNQELAKDAQASFSGASIKFNNKITNQDACKGASLVLTYTVNSI